MTLRTVIYARYSSDRQHSRSIDGQLADCRARCAQEGWTIIAEFQDAAISGAKGVEARPGLDALLACVERGGIDQVLADSTSRIAREEIDGPLIRRRIHFAGARLFTLDKGEIDHLKGWISDYVDSQQRRDLAHHIRRGQRTSVDDGRAPAGIAYGYRQANQLTEKGELVRGLREIDEAQAEVVVRIFREIAAGQSARAVAQRLNAEGIMGPRGGAWSLNTIRGDLKRQNGMLRNRIYIGELIVGRTEKVINPVTRKTVIRPVAETEWRVQAVPHLRIVDQALWDAVQAELAETGHKPHHAQRRPRHLLSGLGVCGECGGGWIRISGESWGCGPHRRGSGCRNGRLIETRRYQAEVIRALKTDLLHPDLAAAYEREYRASRSARIAGEARERAKLERRLGEANRKLERLARAIANGAGEVDEVVALAAAERRTREAITVELANLDAMNIIPLLPGIAEQYGKMIEELHKALESPEASLEAVPRFRNLIHRIVLTPRREGRSVDVRLEGRIDAAIRLATGESPIAGARHKKVG